MIALPTAIPASAMTPIIEVALKYSQPIIYNNAYHGKIPKNHNKNAIIVVPARLKPPNWITIIM
jgi:hypothetical protein